MDLGDGVRGELGGVEGGEIVWDIMYEKLVEIIWPQNITLITEYLLS